MSQINPYVPLNASPAQRDRSQDRPSPRRRPHHDQDHHKSPQDSLEQSDEAVEAAANEPPPAALPNKETQPQTHIDLTA